MAPTTMAPAATSLSGSSDASTVLDVSDARTGRTGLVESCRCRAGGALRLAVLIVVVAEGPEYILAVRFLRSARILMFVGTLLDVVASPPLSMMSCSALLDPAAWLDLLDAGWAGGRRSPPRARHRERVGRGRPERVID